MKEAELQEAVSRGVSFLASGQLPSGQFGSKIRMRRVVDPATGEPLVQDDPSPFTTAHITYSLEFVPLIATRSMTARALDFFRREQTRCGLWRYANRESPLRRRTPPDVDDTACVSELLERIGGVAPANKNLLLLNRAPSGLFYTWMIPRAQATLDMAYWWTMLREQNYERTILFWRGSGAAKDDVQPVVNANVLLYLGECRETLPVVDYLVKVSREGREHEDKSYKDANAFYHAVSRCHYRGIGGLAGLRDPMMTRFADAAHSDGRIGQSELQTALALCSLLNFDERAQQLTDGAIDYLVRAQSQDGGWAYVPFCFDGREDPVFEWGSRELTTGFCVEALARVVQKSSRSRLP